MPIPIKEQLAPECPVQELIVPGQELIVYTSGFYVRAKIDEVNYIWAFPQKHPRYAKGQPAIWNAVHADGLEEEADRVEEGMLCYNQFPWTDWPTNGHAAYVGDYSFLDFNSAFARWGHFPKKGKYRRARNYLRRVRDWVLKTHKRAGATSEELEESKEYWNPLTKYYRRIYV